MRKIIFFAFLFLASTIANAQWEMLPEGNWWSSWPAPDSIFILAPLGSAPINGTFSVLRFCEPYLNDTSVEHIVFRQDSLYGNRFTPEVVAPTSFTLSQGNCSYGINFSYHPDKYEDTSIIRISTTSQSFGTDYINVIGITYIAPSNEYSLSRSVFDSLPSGDTELAILRIFNQTPDTEFVSYSLGNSDAFTFLDSLIQPFILAPGDSAVPIRLRYLASGLRPVALDSIGLSYQRIRSGSNYRTPNIFEVPLRGYCSTPYYRLSKTNFGYIPASDSSIGSLSLYNSTDDSESVTLSFSPQGDFTVSGLQSMRVLLTPHDSSGPMPVVMHASVNRKVINDNLVLNAEWDSSGAEVSRLVFNGALSGRCSDMRFSIDSILQPAYVEVNGTSYDSVTIHNLSEDTVILHCYAMLFTNFSTSPHKIILPPHQVYVDIHTFGAYQPGMFSTEQFYVDDYGESLADTASITLVGVASQSGVSAPLNDDALLSIIPNPSSSEFRIQGMKRGSFFEVYDILGSVVFKSKVDQNEWDSRDNFGNHCNAGQYFGVVISEGNRTVIPILLTR